MKSAPKLCKKNSMSRDSFFHYWLTKELNTIHTLFLIASNATCR